MADLPLPPPFMWACTSCTDLLMSLATATDITVQDALYDGAVRAQLMISMHIVAEHRNAIPDPHDDCQRCAHYAKQQSAVQRLDEIWAEHRARDLFLPPTIARLM